MSRRGLREDCAAGRSGRATGRQVRLDMAFIGFLARGASDGTQDGDGLLSDPCGGAWRISRRLLLDLVRLRLVPGESLRIAGGSLFGM